MSNEGLIVRPGDVLVLNAAHELSDVQIEKLGAQAREKLPGLANVVIFEGVAAIAVYRAAHQADAEVCPYDCDPCHGGECPCPRAGCQGEPE